MLNRAEQDWPEGTAVEIAPEMGERSHCPFKSPVVSVARPDSADSSFGRDRSQASGQEPEEPLEIVA
jgi:hypothetical protein